MKQIKLIALMIILYCNAFSQVYLGTSVMKNGVAGNIGFLADKVDISFGLQFPLTDKTTSTIYSLSVGRMINLSNYDEGNFSLTPAIGLSVLNKMEVVSANVFSEKYGKIFPYETLKNDNIILPYYSLELGKDAYLGRVFIKTVYCGKIDLSFGMRLFLNR